MIPHILLKQLKKCTKQFSRDLNGFFAKVWSVHPFASITKPCNQKNDFGKLRTFKINDNHFFIEGMFGRFYNLRKFKIFNFILSQIEIFFFLKKLIINEKIDYIKAHDPHYNSLIAYLLSRLTKTPFLVRVSGILIKFMKTQKNQLSQNFYI